VHYLGLQNGVLKVHVNLFTVLVILRKAFLKHINILKMTNSKITITEKNWPMDTCKSFKNT